MKVLIIGQSSDSAEILQRLLACESVAELQTVIDQESQIPVLGLSIPYHTIEKTYFEDTTPRNRAERRHGRKI